MTTSQDIRSWLLQRPRAEELGSIAAAFSLTKAEAERLLEQAVAEAIVVRTRKGRYCTPEQAGLLVCRAVFGGGNAYGRPQDPEARASLAGDIRLEPSGDVIWPDDIILVRLSEGLELPRGLVVSVARRAHETLTGSIVLPEDETRPRSKRRRAKRRPTAPAVRPSPYAVPEDQRLGSKILLEGDLGDARTGDLALLRVLSFPHGKTPARATVERILGDSEDIRVKLRAIAAAHGFGSPFSLDTMAESEAMPLCVGEEDLPGRVDLRDLCTFTIDGADAQDFDDAVSLARKNGQWELGVHIADVSHYVRPESSIDKDACQRTTSVYLPGLTFPMLPEALSNRLCSLMPEEDRLTMTCRMRVRNGQVVSAELFPSVIRSRARLVYEDVNLLFSGKENRIPKELHAILEQMNALAKNMRELRRQRGALEFDVPEPEFRLNAAGEPVAVSARERGDAERLIEDFMLAANEAVARFARECELSIPYRIHELPDPDVLAELDAFLESLDVHARLSGSAAPAAIGEILDSVVGTPEEAAVHNALLRAMRKARYDAMPRGHFALAARDYCHFTSPIRRYPDLTVHRVIKAYLTGALSEKEADRWTASMPEIARHCSEGEEAAVLCEREADDRMRARYMTRHVGETFRAVINGCTRASVFVTLENTCEGRIPVWTLPEPMEFAEELHCFVGIGSREHLRIGDRLTVRLVNADERTGNLEFRVE